MLKIIEKKRIVLKNAVHFDPRAAIECGQMFRYRASLGGYAVNSKDRACFVCKDGDTVVIETGDTGYFDSYFDLGTDYGVITRTLGEFPELAECVEYGKGIRIFRQDLFETVISFIISANNHIPRIKGIIERICEAAGRRTEDGVYAFPTSEELARLTTDDFANLGAGYRAQYLAQTADDLTRTDILSRISGADTAQVYRLLGSLKGVGPKVAHCIALFGLGITDSFPVDTWIFKALGNKELDTPDKVRLYYQERYGALAGYAQQYIFYYNRERK